MSAGSGPTILLAIDSAEDYSAVERALIDAGHEPLGALDGDTAAGLAVRRRPLLVVTTPDLPQVRGLELIEIARRARAPLPVAGLLLLSSTDSRAMPSDPLMEVMRTPVGAAALREAVGRLLEEARRGAPGGARPGPSAPAARLETVAAASWEGARTGTLAERSFARLLFDAREEGATAHLALRAGEVEKRLHLLHGRPVNCDSNLAVETLGEMLLADKTISAESLSRAGEYMRARGSGQADALVGSGAMSRQAVATAMARHVRQKILPIFSWDDATWRLEHVGRERVRPLVTDLEPLWLVAEGVRRYSAPRVLLDFHDEHRSRYPTATACMRREEAAVSALVGGPRIIELLDGRTTLADMQGESGLDELLFTQVMLALFTSGLVTMEESGAVGAGGADLAGDRLIGEGSPSSAAASDGGSVGEGASSAGEGWARPAGGEPEGPIPPPEAAIREEVLAIYTRLSEADPFDILGVDADVDSAGLARALAERAAGIGPDRMAEIRDEGFKRLAREVWLRLEEAYAALSDDDQRALWRAERERRQAGEISRRVRWLDADRAFRDGQDHLAAGRYEAANQAFEAAEALNRRDPVYRLYSAWARWLAARDAGEEEGMRISEQAVCRAVEAIPVLEEGWVFLGEIALFRGDRKSAKAHLERALLFNPASRAARSAIERMRRV